MTRGISDEDIAKVLTEAVETLKSKYDIDIATASHSYDEDAVALINRRTILTRLIESNYIDKVLDHNGHATVTHQEDEDTSFYACDNCGEHVYQSFIYCPRCGKRLNWDE